MIQHQYDYRSGIGTDIHRLVPERKLILGGIEIPFELGLLGHSDGDAVLHAVTDAILGAAGLGDIGMMFPDTDPQWKDADSAELLKQVVWKVSQQGWEIVNMDLIVHAQLPKLGPYRGQMKRRIAELLEMDFANVNIKAKTNEGLDAVGECRAIAATAITMLRRKVK
ncbi:MAG TPA: 2-C-methyl-D-erythritol 2,4-cyclodiphosphate synthase [Anaerohalosphaeraceae bacterium]|nr:2-C-methyl-D-erythritol 2,4-cyclodiphosphate synthase [Anaerohalosphaeraceae bacterium]